MTFTRTAVFLAAIVAASSIAFANPTDGDGEARAAIEAANAKFSEAFARGDTKALAAMYTSDAIALPPDTEMVRGNEAIGEFWNASRKGGVRDAKLTTVEVSRSGDFAYEVGTVSLTIQPEGKESTTARAKYVVVWKRQADGSWKLHRDIWNRLPAAK
jgi:uncharacterized protein (TIGR02246 family)